MGLLLGNPGHPAPADEPETAPLDCTLAGSFGCRVKAVAHDEEYDAVAGHEEAGAGLDGRVVGCDAASVAGDPARSRCASPLPHIHL